MEVVKLAFLGCVLRVTTKKAVNFFEEKSAPPEKILAMPTSASTTSHALIGKKNNIILPREYFPTRLKACNYCSVLYATFAHETTVYYTIPKTLLNADKK